MPGGGDFTGDIPFGSHIQRGILFEGITQPEMVNDGDVRHRDPEHQSNDKIVTDHDCLPFSPGVLRTELAGREVVPDPVWFCSTTNTELRPPRGFGVDFPACGSLIHLPSTTYWYS